MFFNLQNRIINSKNPILQSLANHVILYPTPVNFSYAYSFGSLVGIFFAIQIFTGIFLAMHYTAHTNYAFASVVHIMTDVQNGYLLRYMHANGASLVFILLYIHIGRGLYYRSYIYNRTYLWWSGIVIFLLMMATAFIGYVLPWGQMSFWGATVITSLVTAVPFVGENIAYWVWGGFSVSNATLIRFFSLHYLLPFLITGVVFLHLILLHNVTSTNPAQVNSPDKMSFHPYFTFKDLFAFTVTLLFFLALVHFYPNILGHSDNFLPANPLVTPPHIVPEWYFTPFYAILRSCPNKLGGVIFMLAAILILFVIPFYKIPVNSVVTPLSSLHKVVFWIFGALFLILMFLGGKPATAPYVVASQFFTFSYFAYFFFLVPVIPAIERLMIIDYQFEYLSVNMLLDGKKIERSKFNGFTFSYPRFLLFWIANSNSNSDESFVQMAYKFFSKMWLTFLDFCQLWSFWQWTMSVAALFYVYLFIINNFLNHIAFKYTNTPWVSYRIRVVLICADILLNVILGVIILNWYPATELAIFFRKCPLSISPFVFIFELLLLYFYCVYYRRK